MGLTTKHLQSYVDQFSFHYNHRFSPFYELLGRLCGQHDLGGQRIAISQEVKVS